MIKNVILFHVNSFLEGVYDKKCFLFHVKSFCTQDI